MTSTPTGRWCAAIVATLAIAAGCASGADDTTPPGTAAATSTSTPATAGTSTTAAPLTASHRGVTADTIAVGVLTADLDAIRDVVDINNGDVGLVYQTLVDDLNARGGINGRQIDMHLVGYSPLEMVDAERACVDLVEDHEVFVVLGAFFGPVRATNTCVNGTGRTAMIGGVHTPELLDQAKAPWITPGMASSRRFDAVVELYRAEGLLADHTIAVLDAASEHAITQDAILPAMEAAGLDPLVLTTDSPPGDVTALAADIRVFSERLDAEGVDLVLLANSQVPLGFGLLRDNGFPGEIHAIEEGAQLGEIGGYDPARDPSIYDGAVTAMGLTEEEAFDHPTTQRCIETFESANPSIDVMRSDLVPDGEPDWLFTLYGACRSLAIFELAATAAGPDLTNESLAAGAASLGRFELAGQPFNSLAADKLDASDGLRLGAFDSSIPPAGGLRPVTDLRDLG